MAFVWNEKWNFEYAKKKSNLTKSQKKIYVANSVKYTNMLKKIHEWNAFGDVAYIKTRLFCFLSTLYILDPKSKSIRLWHYTENACIIYALY